VIALGLTGYPLSHSLSPRIHQTALDHCGLDGSYALFPVSPDVPGGLRNLLVRLRSGEINGLNVTIPHKQTVIPWLDELTPTARAIGAVNTIFVRDECLTGDNTDAPGFLADLKRFRALAGADSDTAKTALVLGVGGAARAIVYALTNDGWEVILAARRAEQARALANSFDNRASTVTVAALEADALRPLLPHISLVVNATPLGMSPDVGQTPWPSGLALPPRALVYDLVYHPRETAFVSAARAAGLPAVTGLGMLAGQAALAFEAWTGIRIPIEILLAAVEEK